METRDLILAYKLEHKVGRTAENKQTTNKQNKQTNKQTNKQA